MLRHYFQIAIRHLSQLKLLSFINIAGLSIGLACCTLFMLYAINEFSFDGWHKDADRIYRVNQVWTQDNGDQAGMAGLYMPLGPAMKKDFPEVEDDVRLTASGDQILRVNDQLVRIPVAYADPHFFSFFSFPFLTGSDTHILDDPHGLVLTRDRAMQLFGSIDVVGRRIEIRRDSSFEPYTVAGVAENVPLNSSIRFDIVGSYTGLESQPDRREALSSWHMTFGDETYVRLKPASRLARQPDRLLQFRFKYYPEELADFQQKKKIDASFALQPLKALHTTTNIDAGDPARQTNPRNVYILLAVAAAILLIASINFTTLAIARSAGRSREVAVKKIIGSRRSQLILQFLAESLFVTLLSAVLATLLVWMLLPWFNRLADRELVFSFQRYPQLAWLIAGLVLLVGLLAGSYPAFVLSGFKPIEVLKSKLKLGGSNFFTKSLVTAQFVLSIGLIIATVVMLRQVSYMQSKDLGLVKENTIVVNADDADIDKVYPLMRRLLAGHKEFGTVGASGIGLGEGQGQMGGQYDFGGGMQEGALVYPVDPGFIPALGMRMMAGRNFDPSIGSDTTGSVIVNETMVHKIYGVSPAQVLGRQFKDGRGRETYTIVGVVRDFNFEPLTRQVRPQFFMQSREFKPSKWFVRVQRGQTAAAMDILQKTWATLVPDLPFRYSFLDENLDRFYKGEVRWMNILGWAGAISILLACLGLFGLAALAAVNRIKEIGIRRVLGASSASIVQLMAGGFIRLVLLAALIASPAAWYFMSRWLEGFAYRVEIGWWIFAVTAIVAAGIALLTVAVQTLRAARANPVDSLRSE